MLTPERNIELLETTLQFVKDHPEQHVQGSWGHITECGTVACYAGWAVMLSGMPFEFVDHEDCEVPLLTAGRSIRATARKLLGLTELEGFALFCSGNTLEELELMVKQLANRETI